MKWYKKQIDQLKIAKPELFKDIETTSTKNPKHAFERKAKTISKPFVPNPVALRNVNRPKTDA